MKSLKSHNLRFILRLPLVLVVASLGVIVLIAAEAAPAPQGLTVGGFAAMIATRLQSAERPMAPLTPEEGQALLRKPGIKIQRNPNALVTEKDAIDILGQIGVTLESSSPANLLDAQRASAIVGTFGRTIASKTGILSAGGVEGVRSFTGLMLETTIQDCQALEKTQDCQQCCRNLSTADQNDFHTNRICGKACNTKSRNVSASEPTP